MLSIVKLLIYYQVDIFMHVTIQYNVTITYGYHNAYTLTPSVTGCITDRVYSMPTSNNSLRSSLA